MKKFNFFPLGFALLCVLFFTPVTSNAQQQAGLSISPSLFEQNADPGAILETSVTLQNISDETKTFYLFSKDISGVRDGGSPIYANENAERTGFELTEWLSLSKSEVTLAPSEATTVDVTITVPENATPGSHFGAVFGSAVPPRLRSTGAAVGFEVANIISIKVSGDIYELAQIRSFSTDKLVYGSTNVEFTTRMENKGNVLIRPYGILQIVNMYGKEVSSIDFNGQLNGVFPNTIRDFVITWTDESPGFGRYTATLNAVYGDDDTGKQSLSREVSFWILPLSIIKPAAIVLGVLLFAVYLFVKFYIARRIRALSGGRRLVGRRRRQGPSLVWLTLVAMFAVTALFLLILMLLFA